MIKKYVVFFIGLICGVAHADNYITQTVVGGCDTTYLFAINNKTILKPKFQPTEYTCGAGYFLPANTTQCAPCPSGFTCFGGTFAFNETRASGITAPVSVSQNSAKICSANVLMTTSSNKTRLRPIFEPKTVTLTYNDGTGNTSSGTCTYNDLITLPPEPVRPGYTFTGWKLQTNNE